MPAKKESVSSAENVPQTTQAKEFDVFELLSSLDVNEHVEKKDTGKAVLSYLSWVWAWKEVRSRYKDVSYVVHRNEQGLPYFADPDTGIMVFTTVTINGESHDMWLPVMDGANNAMKLAPYEITTKYGTKTVAAATMFDINKAIMRCVAKNLAMFGCGLYIYAGEDLPEESAAYKASINDLVKKIDDKIAAFKAEGKLATPESKAAFAKTTIEPIIGSANFRLCRDADKLAALIAELDKLP